MYLNCEGTCPMGGESVSNMFANINVCRAACERARAQKREKVSEKER